VSTSSRVRGSRSTAAARRAFTLIELLVVISIFLLLLLIAVPAFSSMLYSSEESLAENGLRTGLAAARDAAARGRHGQDAAAVFLYDSAAQKMRIVPCVQAGVLVDLDAAGNPVKRDIFAAVPGFEPTSLPKGWTVRGFALANTIDDDWYGDTNNIYSNTSTWTEGNWLFPENDFYDWEIEDDGANRHTFIVRFEGGTGALKAGDLSTVLILDPAPTDVFRTGGNFSTYRADLAPDRVRFVRNVLAQPLATLDINDRRELFGDQSTDTILARPVAQLALCNEKRLAAALSLALNQTIRVDAGTGCLYQTPPAGNPWEPLMVPPLDTSIPALTSLNEYMERLLTDGTNPIESDARLFTINRFLGNVVEVTGSINGQGVSQ
jgi:prepilin-type N-terminal cleavage/methylation domain-containing protein